MEVLILSIVPEAFFIEEVWFIALVERSLVTVLTSVVKMRTSSVVECTSLLKARKFETILFKARTISPISSLEATSVASFDKSPLETAESTSLTLSRGIIIMRVNMTKAKSAPANIKTMKKSWYQSISAILSSASI